MDRLLASPQYGERLARHWLDLVRYAETYGHEADYEKPGAYQYRDYVIRALNADVPFNRFVAEHVAGDLLPDPRRNPEQGFNELILGTGFWWPGQERTRPWTCCRTRRIGSTTRSTYSARRFSVLAWDAPAATITSSTPS